MGKLENSHLRLQIYTLKLSLCLYFKVFACKIFQIDCDISQYLLALINILAVQ